MFVTAKWILIGWAWYGGVDLQHTPSDETQQFYASRSACVEAEHSIVKHMTDEDPKIRVEVLCQPLKAWRAVQVQTVFDKDLRYANFDATTADWNRPGFWAYTR